MPNFSELGGLKSKEFTYHKNWGSRSNFEKANTNYTLVSKVFFIPNVTEQQEHSIPFSLVIFTFLLHIYHNKSFSTSTLAMNLKVLPHYHNQKKKCVKRLIKKRYSMNGWTVVHPYHRILLNSKKGTSIDTPNNLDEYQGNYIALKQGQS